MEFTPQQIIYQALLFVAVYFALKTLVFDRLLDNVAARHHRTHGALAEAEQLRVETARLRADYETQLAEIRRQASAAREEIRREAEKAEGEILEAARVEAARTLSEARAEILEQTKVARTSLQGEVDEISRGVLQALVQ